MSVGRRTSTPGLVLPAVGLFAVASTGWAQVDASFETTTEPVAMRLSNPWSPDPAALATVDGRPTGRLSNRGAEPVHFVMFLQPVLGFESGGIHVTSTDSKIRVRGRTTEITIGVHPRPVWLRGVVRAGDEIELRELCPVAPERISALLREDRVQVGLLLAAARGALSVELTGLSPLGAEAPDPLERGLLYPVQIQLEGTHDLSADLFATPGPDRPPESGCIPPGAAEGVQTNQEK